MKPRSGFVGEFLGRVARRLFHQGLGPLRRGFTTRFHADTSADGWPLGLPIIRHADWCRSTLPMIQTKSSRKAQVAVDHALYSPPNRVECYLLALKMPVALLLARQDGRQHHSYLILAYAGSKKAAEDAGFYYAASAAARLSGILTQRGGLQACLWSSAAMLAACMALTFVLPVMARERRMPV